ncbi:flavin monoamine oxidase family protein [Streptomyces sp. NPDC058646]|uniref:flavin monoamine oxidase family protein n=1 Tax=Streptomyces sp. NPDC058646 TaxID=3346574 RepID=UPI003667B63C
MSTDYDVIVIGAGFAGITAARELRAKGKRTLLLEARDRIGGRVYTQEFAGHTVELGGAWVHWTQPHVWAELTRYGISTVPDVDPEIAVFPTPDGYRAFPAQERFDRQHELLTALFADADEYFSHPWEPTRNKELIAEADKFTLRDGIKNLDLSPEDEGLLIGLASGESGGSSARGALTMTGHWWALGNLEHIGFHEIFTHRLENGLSALAEAMLADAQTDLRLESPVAKVEDDGSAVHVTTRSGERFSAPAAVVAVPVNVWKTIDFSPGLPQPFTQASTEGIGVPYGVKMAMHIRGDFGPVYAQADEGAPIIGLFAHRQLDDGQLVVGFIVEPDVDHTDFQQVEAAVKLLEPRAELVDYVYHDWGRDEFSQGGWAYRQPGQLALLDDIQTPQPRIAFANGDMANGWSGCVDGAIETGLKAARYVDSLTD